MPEKGKGKYQDREDQIFIFASPAVDLSRHIIVHGYGVRQELQCYSSDDERNERKEPHYFFHVVLPPNC